MGTELLVTSIAYFEKKSEILRIVLIIRRRWPIRWKWSFRELASRWRISSTIARIRSTPVIVRSIFPRISGRLIIAIRITGITTERFHFIKEKEDENSLLGVVAVGTAIGWWSSLVRGAVVSRICAFRRIWKSVAVISLGVSWC